ncbi:hypothetical protein ACFQX6_19450 [Streptosporangium lutulentum]
MLVSGPAFASVTGAASEVQLAGRDALTWSDRLVPGPVTRVELSLPEAGAVNPLTRLDSGVIVGGGVSCDLSEVEAAKPSAQRAEPYVEPEPRGKPAQPAVAATPPPPPPPAVPAPAPAPERRAPQAETGDSVRPAPYPMGTAEPYAPPVPQPPEPPRPPREPQVAAPQAWHSEPAPVVSQPELPRGPRRSSTSTWTPPCRAGWAVTPSTPATSRSSTNC